MARSSQKETNIELNLTPMIDLMSTLVAFLLVSAVWMHIAAIPASVESKGKAPVASDTPKNNRLTVRVVSGGHQLQWPPVKGSRPASWVRKKGEKYDLEQVSAIIESVTSRGQELTGTVTGNNDVPYGAVAETIDAVKAGGVMSVALATN